MSGEKRDDEAIRREIAAEREQLVEALADLRAGVAAKRRPATIVGAALAALLVTAVAARIFRFLRGR